MDPAQNPQPEPSTNPVTEPPAMPAVEAAPAEPGSTISPSIYPSYTKPTSPPESSRVAPPERQSFFKRAKKPLVATLAAFLLIGGSAGAYFGYYLPSKPENVWQAALVNTGKGYDKLSDYVTAPKTTTSTAFKGDYKISGGIASDGSFSGTSQKNNSKFTGSISAVGLKTNFEVRTISSKDNSPDIYFKVSGLDGLDELLAKYGVDLKTQQAKVNDQWYLIDHSLFDQIAQGSNAKTQITSKDIDATLNAVGDATKQYIFTSDPKKMTLVVDKYVGKESQDSRSVYHYKVKIDKQNLKAYVAALCTNLKKPNLTSLYDASTVDSVLGCKDANTRIDKLDTSGSTDAWVDLKTKLIHKIRITQKNKPDNFMDIGQDYQGGDDFPFSVGFSSKDAGSTTTSTIKLNLNTKTNVVNLNGKVDSTGSDSFKATFNLGLTPSNNAVQVSPPDGAKNIIQLFNDLGLGDFFGDGSSSGSAADTERRTDMNSLQSQVEVYFAVNGYYPTLANINDAAWRSTNMSGFDAAALKDPGGTQQKLVSVPTANNYSYQVLPAGCNNTSKQCTSYTLTAVLDSGEHYEKQSLN